MSNFSRKLRLASLAWIATASLGTAVAADLPAYKAPVKAVAPAPSWTGFYVGGNVGYGWDHGSTAILPYATDPTLAPVLAPLVAAGSFPASLSTSAKGAIGGGQFGYNWQMPSQWLIGFETDLQASGIRGSSSQTLSPAFFDATSTTVTKSLDWFGTVRGRVGFLPSPQVLLYGTGGFAYGQAKTSFSNTDVPFGCIANATVCATGASSGVRTGWTAGAGAEAMVAPNWTVKAEYLYVDLGTRTLNVPIFTVPGLAFSSSTAFHEQIARVGLNYHFGWGGPVVAKY